LYSDLGQEVAVLSDIYFGFPIPTHIERVGEFKYLGSMITENSDNNTEIKARVMAGNRSYYSVLPLLRSKAICRTAKIRMYKTIIRPVVLYVSEAWCLMANDEKILCI